MDCVGAHEIGLSLWQCHGLPTKSAVQECYRCLPKKTTSFFVTVHEHYDADWVLKMDDDVYMAPARLPLAMEQWQYMGVEYIGCMKHGDVHLAPDSKWYEPAWRIVGFRNHLHAYGSIYALSGRVVSQVLVPNAKLLRYIANEGATPHPLLSLVNTYQGKQIALDDAICVWSDKCHSTYRCHVV